MGKTNGETYIYTVIGSLKYKNQVIRKSETKYLQESFQT